MTVHLLLAAALFAPAARASEPFPVLRDALRSESPAEREAAAFALGQFGMAEVPEGSTETADSALTRAGAAEALQAVVSDAVPTVRAAAVEALGKVGGRDSESFLLAAATDYDARPRAEAALALFRARFLKRVPDYSTAAVSRLLTLAADPEAEVRWRAAYAFSRWPEPRAAAALGALQSDPDPRVRLFAVRALGKLKTAPDLARLADSDLYVRAEAIAALSAAGKWDALPDSVFVDSSAHARAAAVDAAAESGNAARFAPLVLKALAEPGTMVPGRAVLALAKLRGDDAALEIDRARKDSRWWLRARAYEATAKLSEPGEILTRGVSDADARVASQALESLAASTATNAAAVLRAALSDPKASLEVLGSAVDAAGERADPTLLDALIDAREQAKVPEVRQGIIDALKKTADKHPETAAKVAAALKKFPEFTDKPRRFRAPKAPVSVEFVTERGRFTILLSTEASNHAAAFADSVKRKFYDGLIWHRVVTAFVVQGGDPRGSGWGDAGWRLADEPTRLKFLRGTVGMPKAGPDTGGCQLFVSLVPTPHLDGRYTAFGTVTSGLEVLDRLEPGDKILSARLAPTP